MCFLYRNDILKNIMLDLLDRKERLEMLFDRQTDNKKRTIMIGRQTADCEQRSAVRITAPIYIDG